LSTAFHLLEQRREQRITSPLDLTILDKCPVGMGGASAVAGGYVWNQVLSRSSLAVVCCKVIIFRVNEDSTYLLLLIEPSS
jgi:hypothetical protein